MLTSTQSLAAKCHSREGFYTSDVISRKSQLRKTAEDRRLSSTTCLRNNSPGSRKDNGLNNKCHCVD